MLFYFLLLLLGVDEDQRKIGFFFFLKMFIQTPPEFFPILLVYLKLIYGTEISLCRRKVFPAWVSPLTLGGDCISAVETLMNCSFCFECQFEIVAISQVHISPHNIHNVDAQVFCSSRYGTMSGSLQFTPRGIKNYFSCGNFHRFLIWFEWYPFIL